MLTESLKLVVLCLKFLMSKIDEINNSDVLTRLNLEKGKYFLVSAHREENINSSNFEKIS